MSTTTTLRITSSATVTPEQLHEFVLSLVERSEEPCMLPLEVYEALDDGKLWVDELPQDAQAQRIEALEQELRNIANAKRENFEDAEEFRTWVLNRARHALEFPALAAANGEASHA